MGMTTLWLREVAFAHNEMSLALKFIQTTRPESKMHAQVVGIQETYQAKLEKRTLLETVTADKRLDPKTQKDEDERVKAALGTDKKAGLSSELIKHVPFPKEKDVFKEQFHTFSESIRENDDLCRFSFQCELGAHAMGLYSTGGRLFLMDPNHGVIRYVDSKHLDEDLADAFYNGGYKVEAGADKYTLFKLRKLPAPEVVVAHTAI